MITRPCADCGANITRYASAFNYNLAFCGRVCYRHHKNTGGIDGRGYRVHTVNGVKVKEHRVTMEAFIGRKLTSLEHIHHINGDTLDNRLENLMIVTASEHSKIHKPLTWDIDAAKGLLKNGVAIRRIAREMGVWPNAIKCAFRARGIAF